MKKAAAISFLFLYALLMSGCVSASLSFGEDEEKKQPPVMYVPMSPQPYGYGYPSHY